MCKESLIKISQTQRTNTPKRDKMFERLVVAGCALANSGVLQNEVKIAELVPEIFSHDCFLVGRANLFRREKCTE